MPKISVIVPVYNAEKYLHRCIDSILAQTFTDFELLLIDDGSKDSSPAICDEYAEKDPRVRVFHKENGGVSSARNAGLDNAKGEWITFCDSDDWVESTLMHEVIQASLERNPNYIRYGYIKEYTSGKQEYYLYQEAIQVEGTNIAEKLFNIFHESLYYGFIWNSFFKKDIIDNTRFDTKLPWLEDHTFSFVVMKKVNSCALINKALYHYWVNESGSLSDVKDGLAILQGGAAQFSALTVLLNKATSIKIVESSFIGHMCNALSTIYKFENNYSKRKSFHSLIEFNVKSIKSKLPIFLRIYVSSIPFPIIDTVYRTRYVLLK